MLMLPPAVKVYLCLEPTDMRRSFDRLAGMVRESMGQSPLSGHLFVFRNKRGDKLKILFWDRSGLCLWYKRLEQGTFTLPRHLPEDFEIGIDDLYLMLEGVEMLGIKRQKRFSLSAYRERTKAKMP